MPKLVEFYVERQGRPESKVARDMESRLPSISRASMVTLIKQVMEDEMQEEVLAVISKLEEVLLELKKLNLHQASPSDEDIEDAE